MQNNVFTPMEIDAIGEIMNISLGSSATAVSNMLDHRVAITTPRVSVSDAAELTLGDLNPAVGVEIHYVSGLEGSNIMLLKRMDVKAIVDILLGTETPDEEFELNELTISAVCELMNQMMGAASTALSDFLGRMVNISTPQSFELDSFSEFKDQRFPPDSGVFVVVRFVLTIEGALSSEFVNVISVDLARELIAGFGLEDMSSAPIEPIQEESGGPLSQAEIEKLMAASAAPEPIQSSGGGTLNQEEIERLMGGGDATPEVPMASNKKLSQDDVERLMSGMAHEAPSAPPSGGASLSQEEIERLMGGSPEQAAPMAPQAPPSAYPPYPYPAPGYYPPPGYYYPQEPQHEPPEPKIINTQPVNLPHLDLADKLGDEQAQNLDLIMSVPLEISVEIGRARRKVQDILTFSKGSLVVLDRLAGDQVDLYVNGHCIAKGDVVVVDDNFGLRITEILKPPEPVELLQL